MKEAYPAHNVRGVGEKVVAYLRPHMNVVIVKDLGRKLAPCVMAEDIDDHQKWDR